MGNDKILYKPILYDIVSVQVINLGLFFFNMCSILSVEPLKRVLTHIFVLEALSVFCTNPSIFNLLNQLVTGYTNSIIKSTRLALSDINRQLYVGCFEFHQNP